MTDNVPLHSPNILVNPRSSLLGEMNVNRIYVSRNTNEMSRRIHIMNSITSLFSSFLEDSTNVFFELPEDKSSAKGQFENIQSLSEISTKGKGPTISYLECWEEFAVIQLNPNGLRREFRSVWELEKEIEAFHIATFQ
ncbi:hypothetical protein PAAG_05024 [Paracoccidioides lutzii Pb01]|uniref:Uncharacterized protein n=1 Tax=Paracoccidioides lutzii (strain ATCC MYA-826 / Pb01) TaxID=502779 RepID=C1H2N1_PARBA|nr:hypothetical protein PAAG_05024 [Paracoccidioides lutzii Pb01]EEH33975.2 hypothetical protein PAAG_05024 [Paracoccidioides lutzii Pb01]